MKYVKINQKQTQLRYPFDTPKRGLDNIVYQFFVAVVFCNLSIDQQDGFIINSKRTNKLMFYYPSNLLSPEYFCFFYMPTNSQTNPSITHFENQSSLIKQTQKDAINFPDEEKIILTRQDLQRQGYQQTKRPWTAAEDKLLLSLCKDQNARFEQIATKIEGRNSKMCYSRYRRLTYLTKISWTKSEDERLISLVQQYGENWKVISSIFKEKTQKQLKEHYNNYLKPEITREEWSLDEDCELIRLINKHGKDWKNIEEEFPRRSRSQIKNRYFGKITRLNNKKLQELRKSANL